VDERDTSARPGSAAGRAAGSGFLTTRWSVVRSAHSPDAPDAPAAREALTRLCESTWYPLYAYVRRRGHDADAARDLTQSFFTRLIEKRDFSAAAPEHGRFRAYLLGAMKHFLSNEHARATAQKRGGGRVFTIDEGDADVRWAREPSDDLTPERAFERSWALALLERTLDGLREEYAAEGRAELFGALEGTLSGHADGASRRALAERLGTSENALNAAAHRLRKRYRARLRAEIAETLADPSHVEQELADLFGALG
jgi:RNA polymerase sigma-70 factor (ECF subfamily)